MRSLVVLSWIAAADAAHAEPAISSEAPGSPLAAVGATTIDGGLVLALPTALPTGVGVGAAAGITFGACALRWGPRIAWTTASEPGDAWTVTHTDVRVRVAGAIEHQAGRGRFGLRLGVGGTWIHEARRRQQGERAGLTGSDLATSTSVLVPAADLDAVITLRAAGAWLVVVSGGPSLAIVDGDAVLGWSSQVGVAWTR
jgi:hypothetical protein